MVTIVRQIVGLVAVLFVSIALSACSGGKKLELDIKAGLDGNPATEAKVLVDGVEEGVTDVDGHFSKVIKRKPGTEVKVSMIKESPGYRIDPWEDSFIMKVPPKEGMDKYSFTVDFKATKYFTVVVTEKGEPVGGATIKIKRKKIGATDEKGEFVYEYKDLPKKGLDLRVTKKGYTTWRDKAAKVQPGQRLEVAIFQKAILTVAALTDDYGQSKGISGVTVRINKRKIGKTNAKGYCTYIYRGTPGKKVRLTLTAPGHIPAEWETSVVLRGRRTIQRFFYPTKPKPIRVGIYGYVNNTPDADLTDTLSRIQEAVNNNLFIYLSFQEVPTKKLREKMRKAKLNIETITTKGWQKTRLIRTVDMIILGSVAQDDRGMTIETKVYTSGGKLILSQINTAERDRDIKKTAKDIVRNIVDRFPFEGTILAVADGRSYGINLGEYDYEIGKGMEFALMAPIMNKSGKITGHEDIGTLKIAKTDATESWGEIKNAQKGKTPKVGDKVIRRMYSEEETKAADNSFILSVKGGLPPDVAPLRGVNIYLDSMWVGSTGSKGTAKIPVRLAKRYDIVLYRHGYQRMSDTIRIEMAQELKEFTLTANNSLFKVESRPSGASVFIDGKKIGKTPIRDGKLVNFGFHKLKLSVGGDYRDWEEVMEFNNKVENRTGKHKIVFYKDYLKIGSEAEQKGNVYAAIKAYSSAERDHPDYSGARCRLGCLYMDEKNDYDSAIREFENVLSLPENQQLIHKQFAVTYTNLGHAYYEKGNGLIQKDRDNAAQNFAKAIQNLQTAKQNTRFFPNLHYDEAMHDTYYYMALSYHKLYMILRKSAILDKANLAWREYFDFFPKKLESDSAFVQIRESAEKYWAQIKDLM